MKTKLIGLWMLFIVNLVAGQSTFEYDVQLTPITIPNLPGLQSYVVGQHNGKWLVLGGRKDGLHARQPFNAFPNANNNTSIYVIDVATQQFWSTSIAVLDTGLREQLQSTNMSFYQDNDTLYIVGGYAFSVTANDHVTFNKLTSVNVPNLINAVMSGTTIVPYFKQITNDIFALTGAQLGKIGNTFYLVGGHRFDGRYNPMNNPTFTQTYSNQIRSFTIDNTGSQLSFSNYQEVTDAVHLHRRDYNLVPQVFPDGQLGYTVSSGVFQINQDLPFLYPVDIKNSGYTPQTQFNQYLSNYHSAKVGLYDAASNRMHSLFFGGMSQYYYNSGVLVQDNLVPFVKTISRVTRFSDGSLLEYNLPVEMPDYKGAGAEFIPNHLLPHYENEVLKLNNISDNEFVIGHIYGGIQSSSINPFSANQTNLTNSDASIYEVKLVKNSLSSASALAGNNPFDFQLYPNPTKSNQVQLTYNLPYATSIDYYVTSLEGKLLDDGEIVDSKQGTNTLNFTIENATESQTIIITFVFDKKYYVSKKILKN